MSYQERRAIVSLLTTMLSSGVYLYYVWQRYQNGQFEQTAEFAFWAWSIVLFVPFQVVIKVIMEVVFIVIHIVATKKEEPTIQDEFDRLIDLKAVRNFSNMFMLGFFLSLGTLILNMPPYSLFLGFLLSMMLAGVILDVSQIYFYRNGV